MAAPEAQPAPLRRRRDGSLLGGVCAGLGPRMGIDPLILRVGFVIATVAGGVGIALYLACWILIPADPAPADRRFARVLGRRESWQVAGGIVLLTLAALLLFRAWGIWLGDAVVWPLVLASGGGALIWRQSQRTSVVEPPARAQAKPGGGAGRPRRLRLSRPSAGYVALGACLIVGAALVFLWLNGALVPDRDVTLAVFVVVVALGLLLAPWWLRLTRGLTEERAERIRTQERAEVAAHLHDSVLQTLALMQKRADDPREVAALARRQERELRAWLNGSERSPRRDAGRRARGGGGGARGRARRPGGRRRGRRPAARRRRRGARRRGARGGPERGQVRARRARSACSRRSAASAPRCSSATAGRASTSPRCRTTGAGCASRCSGGWSATAAAPRSTRAPARGRRSSW